MKSTISVLILASTLLLPILADASGFIGIPKIVRMNAGVSTSRVSIFVGPHASPCASYSDWYAYENASTAVGANWTTGFLKAVNSRKVTIVGTGTCDSFGVEKINFVDFN
jgi:hypothetical protein